MNLLEDLKKLRESKTTSYENESSENKQMSVLLNRDVYKELTSLNADEAKHLKVYIEAEKKEVGGFEFLIILFNGRYAFVSADTRYEGVYDFASMKNIHHYFPDFKVNKSRFVNESFKEVNEVLLREKDRLHALDKKGDKVKFVVKGGGSGPITIHSFADTEELLTLKAPNKNTQSADKELAKLGLIKSGSLAVVDESFKEELSQEVKDKIKANNDKMSDLKANNGSQEEVDKLEKENDELNGGNDTTVSEESDSKRSHLPNGFVAYNGQKWAESHIRDYNKLVDEMNKLSDKGEKIPDSLVDKSHKLFNLYSSKFESVSEEVGGFMPAKFSIAMSKLERKPIALQVEVLTYAIKNLMTVMSDKPVNNVGLKSWSAHFLGSVRQGVANIVDEPDMDADEAYNQTTGDVIRDVKNSIKQLVEMVNGYSNKLGLGKKVRVEDFLEGIEKLDKMIGKNESENP